MSSDAITRRWNAEHIFGDILDAGADEAGRDTTPTDWLDAMFHGASGTLDQRTARQAYELDQQLGALPLNPAAMRHSSELLALVAERAPEVLAGFIGLRAARTSVQVQRQVGRLHDAVEPNLRTFRNQIVDAEHRFGATSRESLEQLLHQDGVGIVSGTLAWAHLGHATMGTIFGAGDSLVRAPMPSGHAIERKDGVGLVFGLADGIALAAKFNLVRRGEIPSTEQRQRAAFAMFALAGVADAIAVPAPYWSARDRLGRYIHWLGNVWAMEEIRGRARIDQAHGRAQTGAPIAQARYGNLVGIDVLLDGMIDGAFGPIPTLPGFTRVTEAAPTMRGFLDGTLPEMGVTFVARYLHKRGTDDPRADAIDEFNRLVGSPQTFAPLVQGGQLGMPSDQSPAAIKERRAALHRIVQAYAAATGKPLPPDTTLEWAATHVTAFPLPENEAVRSVRMNFASSYLRRIAASVLSTQRPATNDKEAWMAAYREIATQFGIAGVVDQAAALMYGLRMFRD